ncbi:MAG: LPS export ABC transporter periplasmic protein LptC [Candidatus Omnitrophota bacterium]
MNKYSYGFWRVYSVIIILFFVSFGVTCLFAQEQDAADADQQINDFSLCGYGEKGKKTWDISGKTADIFTDIIKLNQVKGNLYGEKEDIKLAALEGDFNKKESKMHLEKDVVITTSSGARLTTDSLDWDKRNNIITTADPVNIDRDNMITKAIGAVGQPGLNKVELKKDVKVEILPQEDKKAQKGFNNNKVVITCDGPLLIDYEKNLATFNNNVKVDREDSQIYSDTMDIFFNKSTAEQDNSSPSLLNSKINKIIARDNVKIVRGENISYSDEAVYDASNRKIILSGKPKLVIYSSEDMNAPSGN